MVNRIQNIRKDAGFEVTDKIKVHLQKNDTLETAVNANKDYIKSETLTEVLVFEDVMNNGTEIDYDGITTSIIITKN